MNSQRKSTDLNKIKNLKTELWVKTINSTFGMDDIVMLASGEF